MSVGMRLKEIRKAKKINQQEMADFLEVKQTYLSRVEREESGLNFEQLGRIAETYNVNLNWLLTGEGEMFVSPVLEEGEIEDIKALLREIPELREMAKLAREGSKMVFIGKVYQKIAMRHIKMSDKLSKLSEGQLEEKLELFLRMVE